MLPVMKAKLLYRQLFISARNKTAVTNKLDLVEVFHPVRFFDPDWDPISALAWNDSNSHFNDVRTFLKIDSKILFSSNQSNTLSITPSQTCMRAPAAGSGIHWSDSTPVSYQTRLCTCHRDRRRRNYHLHHRRRRRWKTRTLGTQS